MTNSPTNIQLSEGLCGRQIALIGFQADEGKDICEALDSAGALSRTIEITSSDAFLLRGCDAIVLNVNRFQQNAIRLACSAHTPVLALGDLRALRRQVAGGYAWTSDFLVEPWTRRDLLGRLGRLIQLAPLSPQRREPRSDPLVLIADDDEDLTSLLSAVLKDHQVSCLAAHDGPTAIRLSREQLPDLLILDVDMPLMNGFRVLEIIRADPGLRGLGVLMLTGCHSANNVARAASLSINDYLVKPVSPSLLWRRTKALLKPAHDWPERETPNSTCSDN